MVLVVNYSKIIIRNEFGFLFICNFHIQLKWEETISVIRIIIQISYNIIETKLFQMPI